MASKKVEQGFISLDPVPQTEISDYACFANNPIHMSDPDGDTPGEGDGDKDKPKPTSTLKDKDGYEGKASDCGRVYHCGSEGMAEGYYKADDYKNNVNSAYTYNYTPASIDPHDNTTGAQIVAGAYTGMIKATYDFGKFGYGLISGDSYEPMYDGVSNLVSFANPWSAYGGKLRTGFGNWISGASSWDAYDWSYGLAYTSVQLLGSKGVGAGIKGLGITGISFNGWKGIGIGSTELTLGYTKKFGLGFSYRYTTRLGITVAKDLHTVNGKLSYHYHLIQPGIFTKGHINPSILKAAGFGFSDLKIGFPSSGYKKTGLWKALEQAKY